MIDMADETPSTESHASGSVWLSHASGLHARPAIKLTKLAKRFQSGITLSSVLGGPSKDAKSIAQVLSMKIPHGATLFLEARGSDASEAIGALIQLVESDFDAQASVPGATDHAASSGSGDAG